MFPHNDYHRRTRAREKPRFVTLAQEERRRQIEDDRYRREQSATNQRINDALLAEWNALTQRERDEAIDATRPQDSDPPMIPPAPGSIAEKYEKLQRDHEQLVAALHYAQEAKLPPEERDERAATRQRIAERSAREYQEKIDYWTQRDAARNDPMSTFGT